VQEVVTVLVDLGAGPVGQAVAVLAQDPAPPPGKGEEFGKASPIGLVVILLLLIATVFLIRSMTKHLRRVPASFDDDEPADAASGRASGHGTAAGTVRASESSTDPAGPSTDGPRRPSDAAPER
jgi:hypothetical protein